MLNKNKKKEIIKSLEDTVTKSKSVVFVNFHGLKVGEETAQLPEMFQLISDIYKKQTERLISIFLSYLEPITLIILSVLIGFFVFATLLPIFSLSVK